MGAQYQSSPRGIFGLADFERPYRDRTHAGELLAGNLNEHRGEADLLVLGLPRGGVPVAAVVARKLGAELDLIVVRKLGVPDHEELAMGALASGGVRVMNPAVVQALGITEATLQQIVAEQLAELDRRETALRGKRPAPRIEGRTVILVDDGVATGATMRSAIVVIRTQRPKKLVVAIPVAPQDTLAVLRREADEVVCPSSPEDFFAIGQFYVDFSQVTTEEARALLDDFSSKAPAASKPGNPAPRQQSEEIPRTTLSSEVEIPLPNATLRGTLGIPSGARGIVAFAHGSGSSRFSTRNRFVARALEESGLGTLLVDLLTTDEEKADRASGRWRFDIELLTDRVVGVIDWLARDPRAAGLSVGLFGASTGAAAALAAAAKRPDRVHAVVSRGGRPDLAAEILPLVQAPTLLIVGSDDHSVLELNEAAATQIRALCRLEIVPGATHLFEEPGKLEVVAKLAAEFFGRFLGTT